MKREEQIFEQALALTSAEAREAYLADACGDDLELRRLVEELLAAHQNARSLRFLETNGRTQKPDPPQSGPPLTEQPGARIGRYKLLEQIGEGGCGVVYVAEQEEPVRRRVALKVIKLGMDTKSVIARFEAERQALAMMDHPNIAKVFDAGATETGRPYFVMELVRGTKITDYCDQKHLSTLDRLGLFIQVCHAIQHAHHKGTIHRDIKPSNILVTLHDGKPVPKVIDFGIAKATAQQPLTDKTVYTAFQQFIGTPAYMSPEQAEMSGLDIDTRSDVYALGVLLYELLTGRTPFDPSTLMAAGLDELRRIIREEEPVRPSTRLSTLVEGELTNTAKHRHAEPPQLIHLLRGDLDWIVMKCLEKDRRRRYETANNLALDIERHLNHEPVTARSPNTAYRVQKFVRRNKLMVTGSAAVVAALVLGVVVSTWQWFRADHQRARAEKNERIAIQAQVDERKQRQAAEEAHRKTRRVAYASDMNLVARALGANNLGRARELLYRQIPESGAKDLRAWEWRYLWQQCQSDAVLQLWQGEADINSLSISPEGRWLAIGEGGSGRLSILDLEQRRVIAEPFAGGFHVCTAFSPREPLLAFSGEGGIGVDTSPYIWLWDGANGQVVSNLPLPGGCVALAYSRDGLTLVSRGRTQLTIWRIPQGERVATWPIEQCASRFMPSFAVNKDCSLAAVGTRMLRLMDLSTGEDRWAYSPSEVYLTSLAFTPDGDVLASAEGLTESVIRFWDVTHGKVIGTLLTGHGAYVSQMMFIRDGKVLVSASGDQTIRLWDVSDPTRVRPRGRPLRGHRHEVLCLALHPAQRTLVSGSKDSEVYQWDTAPVREYEDHILLSEKEEVLEWRFGPDSRSILTCNTDGQIARWQGSDFQERQSLFEVHLLSTRAYLGVCFSEHGRWLAARSNEVVRIWDVQNRTVTHEFNVGSNSPSPWKFLGQGKMLITLEDAPGIDRLWDLTASQPVHSWANTSRVYGAALSPDERFWIRLGSGGLCFIRNLISGKETSHELGMHLVGVNPAISPDGALLTLPSNRNSTQVWNIPSWHEEQTLKGFLLACNSAAFSADGSRLVTGSAGEEALKLWDTESWQELLTLSAGKTLVSRTTFSPDGHTLGTRDQDYRLHLWQAPSMEEIEAVEKAQANGP